LRVSSNNKLICGFDSNIADTVSSADFWALRAAVANEAINKPRNIETRKDTAESVTSRVLD